MGINISVYSVQGQGAPEKKAVYMPTERPWIFSSVRFVSTKSGPYQRFLSLSNTKPHCPVVFERELLKRVEKGSGLKIGLARLVSGNISWTVFSGKACFIRTVSSLIA